jgi:hypothetical protein
VCWFTGGLFLCCAPSLWGKVRDPSAGSLVSACYAGLLIVFQFYKVVWLWLLLTGSGDELCGLLSALFQAVAYHLPFLPFCLSNLWLLNVLAEISSLPLYPLPVGLKHPIPSATCSFSVPCLLFSFFFFRAKGQSVQGAMLFYPRGAVGILLTAYLLTCWSAECLPSRFGAGVWWHRSPPVLSV